MQQATIGKSQRQFLKQSNFIMMANCIPLNKLRIIHDYFLKGNINQRQLAKTIEISRTTMRKYLSELKLFNNQFPDEIIYVNSFVAFIHKTKTITNRYLTLKPFFQSVFDSIACSNSDRKIEWGKYVTKFPDGYSYTQFAFYFSKWLKDNNLAIGQKNWKIKTVPDNDFVTCKKWRLSTDRRKWEKAVTILDSLKGKPISYISSKLERSPRKVKSWLISYEKHGLEGLQNKRKKFNKEILKNIETKKENLIKLIHESPKNFGINRTSWSLKSLSSAYCQKFGITISISMISEYIKSQGYAFRKAKKVLTSPDPKYQEKLQNITSILSQLTDRQKFFSVDEFGPFAIKLQGGKSIVKNGEMKTYPQWQKSKGSLICTAGLELSHNQITHFYSAKKNTDEMIKLLDILLAKYKNQDKIFFSWDAASWHGSKKLSAKIDELNSDDYRNINLTPLVELAPLPASAQFLNVIESVFSST
jgi:transposase